MLPARSKLMRGFRAAMRENRAEKFCVRNEHDGEPNNHAHFLCGNGNAICNFVRSERLETEPNKNQSH